MHRMLPVLLAQYVGAASAVLAQADAGAGGRVSVDYPVRVTEPGAAAYFFTSIVADPTDARHLLICGIRESPVQSSWQGTVYASHDSGAHWQVALVDSSSTQVSEETCAHGPGGRAYFIAEPWDRTVNPNLSALHLYRSADHGATWQGPVVGSWLDYARMAVDNTSGPYRGVMYAFGNTKWREDPDGSTMEVLVSRDSGRSAGSRVRAPGVLPPIRGNFPQQTRVLPDGSVLTAYWASLDSSRATSTTRDPAQAIFALAAASGGAAIRKPVLIARVKGSGARQNGIPSLDVDLSDGPWRGRSYVVWDDTVGGGERVLLSQSSDAGATWSAPHVIDDSRGRSATTQTHGAASRPSVAVNRDGIVGVTWAERAGYCWRFAASHNGGRTFSRSVPLNPCSQRSTSELGCESMPRAFSLRDRDRGRGDSARVAFAITTGVRQLRAPEALGMAASADGAFHALFQYPDQAGLWVARVRVGVRALERSADTALARLENVSDRVIPVLSNLSYDSGARIISVDLALFNRDSVRSIQGPLYLRIDELRSSRGGLVVMGADNGTRGVGAVWDLTASLANGALPPLGEGGRHRLLFRVSPGSRSIGHRQSENQEFRVLRIYATALGRLPAASVPTVP